MERSNLITVSRLRCWRDCRYRHKLRYLDGWRAGVESEALKIGTLTHLALEAWWTALANPDSNKDWTLAGALHEVGAAEADEYHKYLVSALMDNYHEMWYDSTIKEYEVVSVEGQFSAPLLNPATSQPSRTWKLGGKLDVVAKERATGDYWLVEHKTTQDEIGEGADYWLKLNMDPQINHYYVGAMGFGFEKIRGCLYDVLRKPQLRPLKATPLEKRKYKKGTKELYAGQRLDDESPEEYGARVSAKLNEEPDQFCRRNPIQRTDRELMDYMSDLWDETKMIREAELHGRAPKNPDACERIGRSRCEFWDHCAYGLSMEEHSKWQRYATVHPELEETDS